MTTYYVKNGGNDSKDGLSDANAWATIAKVSGSVFSAGDTINLKRGSSWRETIAVPSSGSAGSPITIQSYGLGSNPKLIGTDLKTSWTNTGGNVWQSAATALNTNICIFNGSVRGTKKTSTGTIAAKYDWWWDANVIYVYSEGTPVTYYTSVEASQRGYGVSVAAHPYITVDGIEAFGCYLVGFNANATSDHVIIQNCKATTGGAGINLAGASSQSISNYIDNMYGNGIAIQNNSCIVDGNIVNDCWDRVDYPSGTGSGVYVYKSSASYSGNIVRNNYITNCFQGIGTYFQQNAQVSYNIVVNSLVNGISQFNLGGATPNYYYNNTVVHNPSGAIGHGIACQVTSGAFVAKNNLVIGTTTIAGTAAQLIKIDSTLYTGIDIDYNLYYLSPGCTAHLGGLNVSDNYDTLADWQTALASTSFSGKDANAKSGDPLLVGLTDGNYYLRSSSPAIDAGVDVSITSDYYGNPVPFGSSPDIGAVEYVGSGDLSICPMIPLIPSMGRIGEVI